MATITLRGTKWQVKIRRKGLPSLSATFASEEAATRWAAEHEPGHAAKNIDTSADLCVFLPGLLKPRR